MHDEITKFWNYKYLQKYLVPDRDRNDNSRARMRVLRIKFRVFKLRLTTKTVQ
jgi:hypothetical protein